MRTKSWLMGVIVAVGATLGLGLLASPAHADLDGNCDTNEVCIWQNANRSGGMRDMDHDDRNYDGDGYVRSCIQPFCSINDSVSSLENRRNRTTNFYVNRDGGGAHLSVGAGGIRANLSERPFPEGGNWNDRISSHCTLDGSEPSWCG